MTAYTVQPYQVRPGKTKLRAPTVNDLGFTDLRPSPTVHAFQPRRKRAKLVSPFAPAGSARRQAKKSGHTQPYRIIGGVHPTYDECFATADHVYEEHRGPQIVPIGILDVRGVMLCRVTMPIKQQLGVNTGGNAWTGEYDEDVEALVPADMLRISTGGGGVSEIDASEYDEDFDDEDEDED